MLETGVLLPGWPRRKATLGIMPDSRNVPCLPRWTHSVLRALQDVVSLLLMELPIHTFIVCAMFNDPHERHYPPRMFTAERRSPAPLFWLRRRWVIRKGRQSVHTTRSSLDMFSRVWNKQAGSTHLPAIQEPVASDSTSHPRKCSGLELPNLDKVSP